jgi:hypothetical protein
MDWRFEQKYLCLRAFPRMNSGKLLILLMVAAGLIAGGLKIWKQHQHMDQVLARFSPQVVRLIAEAPKVELLRLAFHTPLTDGDEENTVRIAGETYVIGRSKDISVAKGILDVRDRLVSDASYDWSDKFEHPGSWCYLLVFTDGDQQARIAFSRIPRAGVAYAKVLDDGPTISTRPIADGLKRFFDGHFAPPDGKQQR